MRGSSSAALFTLAILSVAGAPQASELYKWTDENGVLHVATSLGDVPERYRDKVQVMGPVAPRPKRADAAPDAAAGAEPAAPDTAADGLIRFEIPYRHEGSAQRIIIPVTFNDSVVAPMALDTGSPGMVISVDLAERLGTFSRDSGTLLTEASGIGGQTIAILTIVDSVAVEQARDTFIPTKVTAELSDAFDGLIGMDFLSGYRVRIDSDRRVVVFEQTAPNPESRAGHDESWWRGTFESFRAMRDRWVDLARTTNLRPGSKYRAVIEFQAREAERLYQRLDSHASDHAVPRHWR